MIWQAFKIITAIYFLVTFLAFILFKIFYKKQDVKFHHLLVGFFFVYLPFFIAYLLIKTGHPYIGHNFLAFILAMVVFQGQRDQKDWDKGNRIFFKICSISTGFYCLYVLYLDIKCLISLFN